MPASIGTISGRFPDFPWDTIAQYKALANSHPEGIVDLSIGTPVDPAPQVAQQGLLSAADAHGYPTVLGPESMRQAVVDWLNRRFGIGQVGTQNVLATVGSKELIANLCVQLGVGPGDLVGIPELAYPSYAVSAQFAGATAFATDSRVAFGPQRPKIVFLNFPSNPHGRVVGPEHIKAWVDFAREKDALLVSDECYLEFVWEGEPVSVLDPAINGGSLEGLLAVHSLSKRSNLAGYRDAFVVGDERIVAELVAVRKHLGFMVPTPVAAAMEAALADDAHVDEQRERYARRRQWLRTALEGAGFRIDHSQGSLYLWATRDEPCRDTVAWLAERGILVAPGDFYGKAGAQHVRVAFTATDERIGAAVDRLA